MSSNVFSVNPLKSVRFSKIYIHSGRRNVGASSCAKNSISIFFQKNRIFKGGGPLKLKQIDGLKVKTIIRLRRFVMKNNYFSYDGQYYHQIRGGAMGSPLTLTIANCYMFFFEKNIVKQIQNSGGLYLRYIDDIFLIINWLIRRLVKQVDRWNKFDINIKLLANISLTADFLDLHMENKAGELYTTVYHKPSYEPYYLPFNSVHSLYMKKNIYHLQCF